MTSSIKHCMILSVVSTRIGCLPTTALFDLTNWKSLEFCLHCTQNNMELDKKSLIKRIFFEFCCLSEFTERNDEKYKLTDNLTESIFFLLTLRFVLIKIVCIYKIYIYRYHNHLLSCSLVVVLGKIKKVHPFVFFFKKHNFKKHEAENPLNQINM